MAHQEGLRIGNSSALTAHTGTAGTAEMVRVVATDAGALSVDLVSTDTIKVTVGTINAGTTDLLKAGTITALANGTIGAGTLNTLGTVAKVESGSVAIVAGTVSAGTINAGTITAGTFNVGTITAGTINTGTVNTGTIDLLKAGTITKLEGGTVSVNKLWGSSLGTVVIPTSDTVQSGTLANTFEGYLRGFTLVTPALKDTGTATLELIDSLGGTLISQAQNESVIAHYGTIRPMTTGMEWRVTANGTQDAAATVTFAVHYEE